MNVARVEEIEDIIEEEVTSKRTDEQFLGVRQQRAEELSLSTSTKQLVAAQLANRIDSSANLSGSA